jgi:uncharacterized circularly permuted ATP-grasp superfamily protein
MEQLLAPTHDRLDGYDAGESFDEAFATPVDVRIHYDSVLEGLAGCDLAALRADVTRKVAGRGMTFLTGGSPRPLFLDLVPRVFTSAEWELLEAGLAQRARALNEFIADVHGERRMVAAGRIPERVLESAERGEPDMRRLEAPPVVCAGVIGFDVVRDADGELRVLEDNLRTPSGSAYAAVARDILDEVLPFEPPARRGGPSPAALLAQTLRAAALHEDDDPCIVVLSDGPRNSAWWEHRRLARALGVPLVTPGQLELRGGRVHARLGDGLRIRPVDVVYRRTDETRLRDGSGALTWLGEAFLEPMRRGTVACVNSFGAGVADDKLVHAYVEEMTRFYLGEEPLLRSVPTYDPGDPSVRSDILARIDELVVKPRDGFGGAGVIVCPHASEPDRERAARLIRTRPEAYVAQETICLSTHPTVSGSSLEPRHVDLRSFAFSTRGEARVLTGGLTRVALGAGALVVNSSQNGGAKDTWVLE